MPKAYYTCHLLPLGLLTACGFTPCWLGNRLPDPSVPARRDALSVHPTTCPYVTRLVAAADALLNDIYEASVYTTELLMQHGYQDCLKREQGTLNTSSFNYASRAAACAFGDYALARKTLRLALQTRNETGWFDSHGLSSPN